MSWSKREPTPNKDQPTYVFTETNQNGAVYETYRAADAEIAKAFLLTKRVERELFYIVVETPQGNWGVDVEGLYLENLLPWQADTRSADCVGRIDSITNVFGLRMAARHDGDNFVVRVNCGRCEHSWHDALRYRNDTVVRCPGCAALNTVDSSGIIVTIDPVRQTEAIISPYAIALATEEPIDTHGASNQELTLVAMDHAITAAREALAASPPGQPHRPGRLFNLGCAIEERFIRLRQPADLDAALSAFTEAADTTPPGDAARAERLLAVVRVLNARRHLVDQLADLDAVIAALRMALAALSAVAVERPAVHSQLGLALRDRFERIGRFDDLNEAVTAGREALAGTLSDAVRRPGYLANLSATLRVRSEHTGRREDLDEAVTTGRAAAAAAEPGHPDRVACVTTLGLALHEQFITTGSQDALTDAITAFNEACAATDPDDSNYAGLHHNLGRTLLARFESTSQLSDVEGSVAAARTATAAITPEDPSFAKIHSQYGTALLARFDRTGDPANLDDAIAAHRQAVVATPGDHTDFALRRSGLGSALLSRFKHTGQVADIDESIRALRDAVRTTSATHPDYPGIQDLIGAALHERYRRTNQEADLDGAVVACRQAVANTAPEHARYQRHLSNLGSALHARYMHTDRLADLDDSIALDRDAIAATRPDNPFHQIFLINLGTALIDRFKHTVEPTDLDEAITASRQAVAGTPHDHPLRSTLLNTLSFALRARYRHTAEPSDLDEALSIARDTAAATPPDDPGRAIRLVNLAVILSFRFERTGEPADLDEAITTAGEAVASTPRDHPERVPALNALGGMLLDRFKRTRQPVDVNHAIVAFVEAHGIESGPLADRITAAGLWGHAAMHADRIDSAADGFAAAVRLLPRFASHGLSRATQEDRVARWSGLAADAAACAVHAGRPEEAVELLDAGRSVLWAQLFNLRTDLTELAEREPAMAERLDQIRTRLDTPLPSMALSDDDDPVGSARAEHNRVAEERMRAAREFDDLIGQIRAMPGFERFLHPTSFTELRAAAGSGAVVIVNLSRHGCHALLVSTTGVDVVELSTLTRETVTTRTNTFLDALSHATDPGRSFADRERDRHTILDVLAWLWDTVAEPVLTRLGHTSPPDAAWPRIWWCPTGPLAMLPLHAAGHHPRRRTDAAADTVPDRVISSYTPTLTALLRARNAPALTGRPALLAVGMPATPGASDLPAVPEELDRVHARYPITTRLENRADGQSPDTLPTTARVLAELPRHAWAHFSCHGSQHFSDPTASAFWLADGPLRITDLIHHNPGRQELAFLSACHTATGSPKMVDEAVHLAAAMQLLGYRNVIATLWSIYDHLTPDVADAVYAALTTSTSDAAHALHHAVSALRAQWPTDPLAWAPYLHTGP
nr:CHAT domain-containing protein [Kibdelosporangium sp. MJ126-NF4]CEL18074.1 hypothetical protein [Kibdelosporangium sp. MJ126-NF4]CTQ90697.1 hypothetical protein [Kibdelosporangium sp. MJ126-NF4]